MERHFAPGSSLDAGGSYPGLFSWRFSGARASSARIEIRLDMHQLDVGDVIAGHEFPLVVQPDAEVPAKPRSRALHLAVNFGSRMCRRRNSSESLVGLAFIEID